MQIRHGDKFILKSILLPNTMNATNFNINLIKWNIQVFERYNLIPNLSILSVSLSSSLIFATRCHADQRYSAAVQTNRSQSHTHTCTVYVSARGKSAGAEYTNALFVRFFFICSLPISTAFSFSWLMYFYGRRTYYL